MAILPETVGDRAFDAFNAFGANEEYCDKTYPWGEATDQATGDRLLDWNQRCKKSCSGLGCVSNPGLLAKPWTIVGKNARGLPDSSLLGTALSLIKPGSKAPAGGAGAPAGGGAPGASAAASFFDENKNLILIGGGLAAVLLLMQQRRGGGRRRGGIFGGYSRRSRRTRRTARATKRRGH